MADPDAPPEILSEATARRRLAIYTAIRLAGIAALFGGVLMAQGGVTLPSVLLLLIGAASLFVRPNILRRWFGSRW